MSIFQNLDGFVWDNANERKIWLKHKISIREAEQPFFNVYFTEPDTGHSQKEQRFTLIGVTNSAQVLFIVFTIRNKRIRIISARPASKKERLLYEQAIKETSEI